MAEDQFWCVRTGAMQDAACKLRWWGVSRGVDARINTLSGLATSVYTNWKLAASG